jgi:iron complex transport system substrate-binding protein
VSIREMGWWTMDSEGKISMRRSPVFVFAALILLASMSLGTCGGTPTQAPPASPTPEPGPEGKATPAVEAPSQAGGIIVVDALGRTVEFAAPPQRIVIAGKSTLTIVDTLYMFPEAKDRLSALVVGKQPIADFLTLADPSFGQKTILDVEAGPEQIAPLDPDVVVLKSVMAEKLGKGLEQLDIPVVYVDLETPEQYLRDVATLGQLLANESRAEEIQAFYQSRLDDVKNALQGLGDGEKPRILLVQYSDQGGEVAFNVPPASWIQTTQAEMAGALPVWKEAAQGGGWTVVNLEQIAAWNPDQVFVISYQSDAAQVVEKLKAEPAWQALTAVQKGQVYGFAGDIFSWDQPDPRWILGTIWLAGKVHPDHFPGLDVKQQVTEFFGQMYGIDEAIIQQSIIPNLKGSVE